MCFFDSPVGRCEAVRELVLLDETQRECAREHGCPQDRVCPLLCYFYEVSGVSDPDSLPPSCGGVAQAPSLRRSRGASRQPALVEA